MSALEEDQFQRLVQLAGSAALDQRKWRWFLEELHRLSGGVRVQLFGHDSRVSTPLGVHEYGYDPDYFRSYEAYYGAMNPWAPVFAKAQVGKVLQSETILPLNRLEATEFYNDWVRPQEDIVGGAGTVLERTADRATMIGGNIARRDRDRLEVPFAQLLQRIVPFLQQSVEVSRMLGGLTLDNRLLREGMEPGITAIFALDLHGRVRFTNKQADQMAGTGDLVRIDATGQLRFTEAQPMVALRRALHDHIMPEASISLPFFTGANGKRHYMCRTTALSDREGPLPWLSAFGGASSSSFVLLLMCPVAPRASLKSRQPTIG
ncbi:hypothetical protein [Tropicimonas aquimaris]|uniref:PAS domain-containing protein n=1 Tax=Tropicimonas aquimaris TaxID=914152 RepID=A0ABW3IM03_9RHOB